MVAVNLKPQSDSKKTQPTGAHSLISPLLTKHCPDRGVTCSRSQDYRGGWLAVGSNPPGSQPTLHPHGPSGFILQRSIFKIKIKLPGRKAVHRSVLSEKFGKKFVMKCIDGFAILQKYHFLIQVTKIPVAKRDDI